MQGFPYNAGAYADKPLEYYNGLRLDIVKRMGTGSDARVLEIGCGNGRNGALVKAMDKAGTTSESNSIPKRPPRRAAMSITLFRGMSRQWRWIPCRDHSMP